MKGIVVTRAHGVIALTLVAGVLALRRAYLVGIAAEETDLDDVGEATAITVGSDS